MIEMAAKKKSTKPKPGDIDYLERSNGVKN